MATGDWLADGLIAAALIALLLWLDLPDDDKPA